MDGVGYFSAADFSLAGGAVQIFATVGGFIASIAAGAFLVYGSAFVALGLGYAQVGLAIDQFFSAADIHGCSLCYL